MYLRYYSKVTLLGGPLSHTHLHRGNCVAELHNGFCQSLVQQHHNKMINATDVDPGDINTESDDIDENEAICDELARHYAQHGLMDPEGYFDSADEEVQTIMSQNRDGRGAHDSRDVGTVKLNVFEQSQDNESIETLSGHENSEDEEFLGYYAVDLNGKKRPIPAPRRLVRTPAANGNGADASSAATQSSISATESVEPKTVKEVVLAEVRGIRISLSTDSQGRDLLLIPPGSDRYSTPNRFGTPSEMNTLPQQKSKVLNTLPQYQNAEGAWHQAGPEFRQGQTRFRIYGNTFDAGVVRLDYIGPRPFSALVHTTTNINKPTDISLIDNEDIIPLRTVAHATAYSSGKTGSTESEGRSGFELNKVYSPANEAILGNPESHLFSGSTEIECDSTMIFPSKESVGFSQPRRSHFPTKSIDCGNGGRIVFRKRNILPKPPKYGHIKWQNCKRKELIQMFFSSSYFVFPSYQI